MLQPFSRIKHILCLILSLIASLSSSAQESDLEFLKNKIRLNYPGFADKTAGFNYDSFITNVARLNEQDTFKLLSTIVGFFDDQHLQIYTLKKFVSIDTNECNRNLNKINVYLNKSKKLKRKEGYWLNDYNDCIIGIMRAKQRPAAYTAYVIEDRNAKLYPGQVLGYFEELSDGRFFTDFLSPYSGGRYFVKSIFRNDSVLTTGADAKWKKVKAYSYPALPKLKEFSYYVSGKILDEKTYLITLPGSAGVNVKLIDSLVNADYEEICKRPNLIIDIRNNMGGTVRAYEPLIPFICTNPIVKVGLYSYSTEDGIANAQKAIQSYINRGKIDSSLLKLWIASIESEKENIGKFILLDPDTFKCDSILEFPKNVGLIINYACQSASELMIMDFKQSKKVTLFGEHTMGAVDYLDYFPMNVPSGKYVLYIPTTKRVVKSSDDQLDQKGIFPDVEIADNVDDWVEYVRRYYDQR